MAESVAEAIANLDKLVVEAGTGTGRWYIQEQFQRIDGDVGIMVGHYDDTYVRTPDGWRFTGRNLTVHYGGKPDLSTSFNNAWAEPAC